MHTSAATQDMHSGAPRPIAMAPVAGDTLLGGASGVFPFGVAVPPFFPFQQGSMGCNSRNGNGRNGQGASRHMAAEQRRRARINERLDALRSLVPHAARANTAAFLSEVYNYIVALQKQMDKNGISYYNLDVATEEKVVKVLMSDDKNPPSPCDHVHEMKSDVDSDLGSPGRHNHEDAMTARNPTVAAVSVPSLFEPSTDKAAREEATTQPTVETGAMDFSKHSFRPCAPASDVDYHDNNQSNQALRTLRPAPSNFGIDGSESLPMQPFSLPVMPNFSSSAAMAAAAQSWSMAAAMAQAQAAQIHAQAQAVAQAQVQAHVQAHVQALNMQDRYAPALAVPPKKKRRTASAESCSVAQRSLQGVVRPIALKPQ